MDLMGAPSDRIAQQAVDRSVAASQAERGFSSTKNDGTTSQPPVQTAAIAGCDNAHQAEPQPAHSTSATGPRLFHAIIPHHARLHDAGRTESCIHGLQDGLDVLRAEARRTFSSTG